MSEVRPSYHTGAGCYHDILYPDGKVAFRCDFDRGLIQTRRKGEIHTFDLYELRKNILGVADVASLDTGEGTRP